MSVRALLSSWLHLGFSLATSHKALETAGPLNVQMEPEFVCKASKHTSMNGEENC